MPLNKVELLVEALVAEVQVLDAEALDVFTNFTLDNATGVNLDVFGVILGRARADETDDLYRDILRAQIRLNTGSGTIPDLLFIVALVIDAPNPLVLTEGQPAEFEILVTLDLPAGVGAAIGAIVQIAKGGGIKGNFKYYQSSPRFAYDGGPGGGIKFDGGSFYGTSVG
jgi:hypothetical protein